MFEGNEFYEDYGKVSCAFSALEFEIHLFLIGLCFQNDYVKAAPYLDNNTLGSNIQILDKICVGHWEKTEFSELVKSLKSLVSDRNKFVHGLWKPHTYDRASGYAALHNRKIVTEKFSNGGVKWTNGSWKDINKDYFNKTLKKIARCIEFIELIKSDLEADETEEFDFEDSNSRADIYSELFTKLI